MTLFMFLFLFVESSALPVYSCPSVLAKMCLLSCHHFPASLKWFLYPSDSYSRVCSWWYISSFVCNMVFMYKFHHSFTVCSRRAFVFIFTSPSVVLSHVLRFSGDSQWWWSHTVGLPYCHQYALDKALSICDTKELTKTMSIYLTFNNYRWRGIV